MNHGLVPWITQDGRVITTASATDDACLQERASNDVASGGPQ